MADEQREHRYYGIRELFQPFCLLCQWVAGATENKEAAVEELLGHYNGEEHGQALVDSLAKLG